jgi:transcriptional regulator with XRE-family HTH domain
MASPSPGRCASGLERRERGASASIGIRGSLPGAEVRKMTKRGPDAIDKHVGARVRMRRMMLEMSQQQLAKELGLTFQQVQKYEKGTNRMGASRLQRVAQILQVPITFLFEDAPAAKREQPSYSADLLATPDGLALSKAFTRIRDKRLRRCIVDLVEASARS